MSYEFSPIEKSLRWKLEMKSWRDYPALALYSNYKVQNGIIKLAEVYFPRNTRKKFEYDLNDDYFSFGFRWNSWFDTSIYLLEGIMKEIRYMVEQEMKKPEWEGWEKEKEKAIIENKLWSIYEKERECFRNKESIDYYTRYSCCANIWAFGYFMRVGKRIFSSIDDISILLSDTGNKNDISLTMSCQKTNRQAVLLMADERSITTIDKEKEITTVLTCENEEKILQDIADWLIGYDLTQKETL